MGVRNSPQRQDMWGIIVVYQGNTTGFWDKKSGGAVDSDDNKYYPGAMAAPISLGGRKTTDNVTLQRIYDRDEDHLLLPKLIEGAGKSRVKITQRPYDQDGNGYGDKITYNGILKRVQPPDVDSESGSAAMLEIEVTISGTPEMTT